jgi:hypothetical protein
MNPSFVGHAIRLRRDNGDLLDIPFLPNGELDMDMAASFVGSGDGHVERIYNQITVTPPAPSYGIPAHQLWTNTDLMPRLFVAGMPMLKAGKPSLQWRHHSDFFPAASLSFDTTTIISVAAPGTSTTRQQLFAIRAQGPWHSSDRIALGILWWAANAADYMRQNTTEALELVTTRKDGSQWGLRLNTQEVYTTPATAASGTYSQNFHVGGIADSSPPAQHKGYISLSMGLHEITLAETQSVEQSLATYYNIP